MEYAKLSREIKSHKSNGLNNGLELLALDEPGTNGACSVYEINLGSNQLAKLQFQAGPGFNGISNEVLLAIIEDRLLAFSQGKFGCQENDIALSHVQDAILWLHKRTEDRSVPKDLVAKFQTPMHLWPE